MRNPALSGSAVVVARGLALVLVLLATAGCATRLVQPYDAQQVSGIDTLFVTASTVIDDGIAASPRTDPERAAIRKPEASAAHYAAFAPRYDALLRASDLLLLHALAGNGGVDPLGQLLHDKINALIDSAIPSVCADLSARVKAAGPASLEVANMVDLKCLLTRWKEQHADPELTRRTLILKTGNWEARRAALFNIVLAIQRAELSKQRP
ncbi:MAG: hypothetical protein NVS9B10_08830 [Nevskia sp.]